MLKRFISSVGLGIATFAMVLAGNSTQAQAFPSSKVSSHNQEIPTKLNVSTNQKYELNYPANTDPRITYPKASASDWVEATAMNKAAIKKPIPKSSPAPLSTQPVKTKLVPMDFDEIDGLAQELYEESDYQDFQLYLQYRQQHDLLLDSLEDENSSVEATNIKIDQLTDKYPDQVAQFQKYFDIAGKKLNMMR
jgi:hypothetical protein